MSDPPSNVEAEAALLGAMLADKGIMELAADRLEPGDFYEPVHAQIFETAVRELALGKGTSPVALKGFFEHDEGMKELGGPGYLARLTGMGEGFLAPYELIAQITDLSRRRTIHAGLSTAADACCDLEASIGDIIGHADSALNITEGEKIHQPTGGECLDELIAGFGNNADGVRSGLTTLDDLLGPMRPGQLIIGAGRPGMGKTALALSYALGAARIGHGVLFVSLEMSSVELAARMAADLCFDTDTQVPFAAIRDGRLSNEHFRKVQEARDYMHTLPFQVVDKGSLKLGRLNTLIRRHARKMAAKGQNLELVIVDYLQRLQPDNRVASRYEVITEVSMALKAMAKDHRVAMFALAQLSREVEKRTDKRPQLADLRESGQIEQDADAVLFLLRQEYYVRKEEGTVDQADWEAALQKVQGQIEYILAKRRNGVEGTAMGKFFGAYQAVR